MTELMKVDNNATMAHTVGEVVAQVQLIQGMMDKVMIEGDHYGTIPGCGIKKVLLKPGAEKLSLVFKLACKYKIDVHDLPRNHREVSITCSIYHQTSGIFLGEGVGSCSTEESKFRWRTAKRACPECGAETIINGKVEYGGGFLCWKAKGGCGAKFLIDDKRILDQPLGRIENEDIADTHNTVLKMAKKRAQVDAILSVTAASDIFTQDLEENMDVVRQEPVSAKQPDENPNIDALPALVNNFFNLIKEHPDGDSIWLQIQEKRSISRISQLPLPILQAYVDKLENAAQLRTIAQPGYMDIQGGEMPPYSDND